ncbi:hypothetical protein B0A48_01882 [Cryoendolithus antarcticus]|uniref:Endo-1,4-beta-xylanase n=1 Tax=Cryoendolithus antarcticus TaxID=1507870 RepID=A0A1V8TQJ1_9PEZI|nr:hypothetical protein B0A48_01882 [Cryoendolithus antarcticus]
MGKSSFILALAAVARVMAAPVAEPVAVTDLVKRAQSVNYNQNYIASGANVQYSPNQNAGSFSVNWNTNGDFVVGLGYQTGDSDPITYSGSFSVSSGTPGGLLSIYGWTTNPLVEYYVVENQGKGYNPGGSQKGTFTTDGSSYVVWQHQQTNQPSIQGTSTFQQYISIRQSARSSGTVTLANHFSAWSGFGMQLGTQNFQVLAVESWQGAGSASLKLSKGAAAATTTTKAATTTAAPTSKPASTSAAGSTSAPAATTTASSSGGSAQWGQCGGSGWSGPTSCVSPYTCHVLNPYYSQCY